MIDLLLAAAEGVNYSLILDVAVCLFLLIFALVGLSKGFFNCILKIFGTLGAVLIAWFTAKPVLAFVNGIVNVSAACAKWMSGYFSGGVYDLEITGADKATIIETIEGSSDIFGPLKSLIKNVVENATISTEATTTLGTIVSAAVGHMVATVLVGVALFILIKIVVALLAKLFDDATSKNGALNGLDKLLGLIFGLAKGILFLCVAFIAVNYLCIIPSVNDTVNTVVQNSTVTKLPYNLVTDKVEEIVAETDWSQVVTNVLNKLDELNGKTEDEGTTGADETPAARFVITLD